MDKKQTFKSVLDFKPKFENVIDTIMPDIEHSYAAIMNNTNMQTYFNMFSMELYDLEYFQLLRLHKLELKAGERSLNLTILEMVYNIISKIKERGLKVPEYIAYDLHILPTRIEIYAKLVNYRFVETETIKKKEVYKLVPHAMRDVMDEIVDNHHDDAISNLVNTFKLADKNELSIKLTCFKNLYFFVNAARALVFQKFGIQFGESFFAEIEKINSIKSESLSEKDVKYLNRVLEDFFTQSLMVIYYTDEAIRRGVWDKIKEAEKRRIELEIAEEAIREANAKVSAIKEAEKIEKTLELSMKPTMKAIAKK